ncbi:MAG: HK97 family phage prohead protease [Peptostreptococcaceae bacterium]|nr:HK97 family phage prohead protease [Peptostreptococcaceae bacterium]
MKIEIRGNKITLDGYVNAVARDSRELSSVRGKFVEQIEPKVFERALMKADNVDLLFNHDRNRKLGSVVDGNLELFEDAIGLRAICTVEDEEVIRKAQNNELRGWSFGFICNEDSWEERDGINRRYVKDLSLLEVSILDKTPAYIATSIEARGEESVIRENRILETEIEITTIEPTFDKEKAFFSIKNYLKTRR